MRKMRGTCSSGRQTGCGRMTGLAPLAATRNVHLFSPFPGGKLGTRARAHDRGRASESRNAFLHSPIVWNLQSAGSRVTRDWIFHHRGIELLLLGRRSSSFCHVSNIHAIFIVTIANGLYLRAFFAEVGRREKKRRRERKKGGGKEA